MLEDEEHNYVIISLNQVLRFMSKAKDMLRQQEEIERLTNSDKPPFDPSSAYFRVSCSEHMLQDLLFKISLENVESEEE